MNILRFSVGSEKRVAVRCVFAIGVVCWANFMSRRLGDFLLKKRPKNDYWGILITETFAMDSMDSIDSVYIQGPKWAGPGDCG